MGKSTELRIKLSLFVTLLLFFTSLAFAYIFYQHSTAQALDRGKAELTLASQVLAKNLSRELQGAYQQAQFWLNLPPAERIPRKLQEWGIDRVESTFYLQAPLRVSQSQNQLILESRGNKVFLSEKASRDLLQYSTLQGLLIDAEGKLLAATDPSYSPIGEEALHLPIVRLALANDEAHGTLIYSVLPHEARQLGAFHDLSLSQLTVILFQPLNILLPQQEALIRQLGLAVGIVVLVTLLLSLIATQGIAAEGVTLVGKSENQSLQTSIDEPLMEMAASSSAASSVKMDELSGDIALPKNSPFEESSNTEKTADIVYNPSRVPVAEVAAELSPEPQTGSRDFADEVADELESELAALLGDESHDSQQSKNSSSNPHNT